MKPEIIFSPNPDPKSHMKWRCSIVLGDGEYHGGEGATQCEALMKATTHWAFHGAVR